MIDAARVLRCRLDDNDARADTVGDYLVALLRKLWTEKEGFSGKRPFGNGGWDYDLAAGLIRDGVVDGKLDSDGCVERVDEAALDAAVLAAIDSLRPTQPAGDSDGPGGRGGA